MLTGGLLNAALLATELLAVLLRRLLTTELLAVLLLRRLLGLLLARLETALLPGLLTAKLLALLRGVLLALGLELFRLCPLLWLLRLAVGRLLTVLPCCLLLLLLLPLLLISLVVHGSIGGVRRRPDGAVPSDSVTSSDYATL